MLFALTFVLSSLILPAACQFFDGEDDGFHPDGLTAGLFAILCIFAFLFGVMGIWNFVALLTSRGHRSPYAFLLPTILFFSWSNAAYIAGIILENIPSLNAVDSFDSALPPLLIPSLFFVSNLFNNWAMVLQFFVLIAVLWNRESFLRTITEGKSGGHHPALTALHATLATLTFIFGTATEALYMDLNVRVQNGDFFGIDGRADLQHRIDVRNQTLYVFTTFAILMAVDVAVTTVLLWRAWKKTGNSDKITNLMLYAVVPFYCIFNLSVMIFTIVFSPSGISSSASPTVFEAADLADSLFNPGIPIVILFFILFLSVNKMWWNPNGVGQPPKQQYWAPQPQYMYASPPQVPQAGYYVAGQQPMAYGQPQQTYPEPQVQGGSPYGQPEQMYPQAQGSLHVQYAQPHETGGSYTTASPPPTHVSPGSYSPPQSAQGQPIHPPEKTGLHVA
ncbi:hypothetical protein B0H19DRAFT_205148 [Mycena capillaripes]|nr:hypothetical protein B0H19DRAFT_205148 [Mycena capillaripes]